MFSNIPKIHEVKHMRDMESPIVTSKAPYAPIRLTEPTTCGYIHLAAEVQPRAVPVLPNRRDKSALLTRLKIDARQIEALDTVARVTIFDSLGYSPLSPYLNKRQASIQVARFDVVVLIETISPAATSDVQATPAYQALMMTLRSKAKDIHAMSAHTSKRMGDVDTTKQGLFRFNYFVADDAAVMVELWESLAEWYAVEAKLTNAILLAPLDGEQSRYVAIDLARLDERFLGRQLSQKSYKAFVQATLEANRVGAMRVLYRLA